MQAILTKYIPASSTKGSRIKATCEAGSLYIPYPHELSGQAVYRAAAEALVKKLGWSDCGPLLGGGIAKSQYVFVFNNRCSED